VRWLKETLYVKEADFVSPPMTAKGRKPIYASPFVTDYLRPEARKVGMHIESCLRFGLHNFRHSLSNWLVDKATVEPKTVLGIPRHSKIHTTLDLYTQEDSDETRRAQGEFLNAVGMSTAVNQNLWVELWVGICIPGEQGDQPFFPGVDNFLFAR
jgi:integrase